MAVHSDMITYAYTEVSVRWLDLILPVTKSTLMSKGRTAGTQTEPMG